jgi:SAM-dependent methyltransferase
MAGMDDDGQRRLLRSGFDVAAEAYERTRPVCPPRLFDDLMEAAGLARGDRVAEIGCGTGQASVPMAERGLAVTAVELGADLAAVARRRLAAHVSATVVTSAFEDWEPGDCAPFDAVAAFNSLHWIDPHLRYAKPALLAPGGALAVGGCRWARPTDADRFWFDVQEDYRAVGYEGDPPPPPEAIGPWHLPPEAAEYFDQVMAARYPFTVRYRAEDYLDILASQAGTRALGPDRSAEFLDRVRHRLESLGAREVTAAFVGLLTVGCRPDTR